MIILSGPVQVYERYYRSQVKTIECEGHAGCSLVSITLGRYAQTNEAVEDALFCSILNLLSDVLSSQKKTCSFAQLLHLPDETYLRKQAVLTAHIQRVL